MPRAIGTSTGVKLTRHRPSVRAGEVLHDLGRVPVDAADAVRRGVAHHLAAEQVRLGRLARAAGAGGGDHDDVGRRPGRRRRPGASARRRDRRVAAGHGDPARAAQQRRAARAAPAGRRARCRRARRRRTRVHASASRSRKSAPQSMTSVSSASVAAIARRLAVRQGQEHDVVTGQRLGRGLGQHPVGERRQVRLEGPEPLPGVAARGQRRRSRPRVRRAGGAAARRRRTRWLRRPRP